MKYVILSESTPVENKKNDAKLPEGFWDGVEVLTYTHQHIRVPELRGEVKLQVKFEARVMYLRTISYMMTTRPVDVPKDRANIDIRISGIRGEERRNSPDEMIQDGAVHPYVQEMNIEVGNWGLVQIRFEFDGRDNGVGEKDSWGPLWMLYE
jgi:hypothetical protein